MNKIALFISIMCGYLIGSAQETLSPLSFNPAQYHRTKQFREHQHKYLIEYNNVIVPTDTLTLPFSDDFSSNRLRSYKWIENNITDTFYNVFGTCLGPEGIPTISGRFMNDTAWAYTYNTTSQSIDSSAIPPLSFTFFGPSTSGCFAQAPQLFTYWPEYYTYTFDTLGNRIDSALVNDPAHPSDTINYAPVIYFAANEPGTIWFDNYAYVNNTYPVLPPTIGVATLDGLNEYGLPYDASSQLTYGDADRLTSKPINLSGLSEGDSVYLSFFFEGMGLGEFPDVADSLIVDFRDNAGFWRTVWWHTGYSVKDSVPNRFEQVLVKVPDLAPPYNYFHSNFQFRFRNKASLYGNLDHWHIDYVRFDKNRSNVDTIIQDIAFVYPFPTLLKNFTLLPADQLSGSSDFTDTISLLIHNMDPNAVTNPPATNFVKGASELYPAPAIVSTDVLQTFNAEPYSNIEIKPSADYVIPNTTFPVDSLVLLSNVVIQPNDSRPQNDTLIQPQIFSNIMAYDDGSAESAYGLTGTQLHKFAYEFNLNQPDTLVGFQFMYAQVEENVNNLIFNINVWDSLRTFDFSFVDEPILSLDNHRPSYVDSTNGFTTYVLDSPIIISNKMYLGWSQNDTRSLQVGYDLNSPLGRSHMFVYINGQWRPTTITTAGSPMIRLIFDSNYPGYGTGIKSADGSNSSLLLYPNPTSGQVFLKNNNNEIYQIDIVNTIGETVKSFTAPGNNFSMASLDNGVYIVLAHHLNGKIYRFRMIKTAY